MTSRAQILEKVKDYASKVTEREYDLQAASEDSSHDARLGQTLSDLRERIERENSLLQGLGAHTDGSTDFDGPSSDPKLRLHQLLIIKGAYDRMAVAEPFLPVADSVLPVLIAFRNTQRIVSNSKVAIASTHVALKAARHRLLKEQADMCDNRVLSEALGARIAKLQVSILEKSQESLDEAARTLIDSEVSRRQAYEADTKKATRALVTFINSALAPLLAAEELGGPVTGSVLGITNEMLAKGFNLQGKPNKSGTNLSEDKRQLRIDQIWGAQGETEDSFEEQPRGEAEAAAKEMRDLIEMLLESVTDQGSGQYVTLKRESAASRFLVRANVATLHRSDARRIRLIDFGREVEN